MQNCFFPIYNLRHEETFMNVTTLLATTHPVSLLHPTHQKPLPSVSHTQASLSSRESRRVPFPTFLTVLKEGEGSAGVPTACCGLEFGTRLESKRGRCICRCIRS